MKIHPIVWFLVAKDLIVGCVLYYSASQTAALWWFVLTGLLYSIAAVNGLILMEERLKREGLRG